MVSKKDPAAHTFTTFIIFYYIFEVLLEHSAFLRFFLAFKVIFITDSANAG